MHDHVRYCYVAILSVQRIVEDCSRRTNSGFSLASNLCMLLLACVAASTDQASTAAARCMVDKHALLACIRSRGVATVGPGRAQALPKVLSRTHAHKESAMYYRTP